MSNSRQVIISSLYALPQTHSHRHTLCLYSLCLSRDTLSLQILHNMQRCSSVKSSYNNSNYTESDTDDGVKPHTALIEVNKFANNNNENDEGEA
jgi:hypothetical protein